MGIDIDVHDGLYPRNQKPRPVDTYYRSYCWYRDKAGMVLREEWFTWDGHTADLLGFRESFLEDHFWGK